MTTSAPFLVVSSPVDRAVQAARGRLLAAGLQVFTTFDLQAARQSQTAARCPQHLDKRCDCQMVVLLVYAQPGEPLALLVQGSGEIAHFSLASDTPEAVMMQVQTLLSQGCA